MMRLPFLDGKGRERGYDYRTVKYFISDKTQFEMSTAQCDWLNASF